MSLTQELDNTFAAIGADVGLLKTLLNGGAADLTALTTTSKTSLVSALNSLKDEVEAASAIDDTGTSTASTWSSSEIATRINTAVSALVAGAPTALDTLSELSAALNDNPTVITSILNAQALRVSVASNQTFTTAQKLQACNNIDVGDPNTNFLSTYTTARG